jgi:hypothetical protein
VFFQQTVENMTGRIPEVASADKITPGVGQERIGLIGEQQDSHGGSTACRVGRIGMKKAEPGYMRY